MITQERIETNQLLMEMVGLDLTEKSLKDNLQAERYYTLITEHIESQIQSAINWIDSDSAREFFFNDAYHQAEIWDSLEEDWDTILSGEYETIDDLLEEVYDYGKSRGYSDMAETLRYTPTDRLAFAFARNYNYGLIQNLDSDLRGAIKDRMTRAAIQGENPYSLAPHLRKLGLTQLPGSTFTPYQRAVLIARTETSRIQNTGILQSYVNEGYTRVKILTAEDDNVCTICLKYAFEFNSSDKVTFENRGEERTHNIRDLLKGGSYPPFHPQCRCTYLSVWESKGPVPDEPYMVNLTPIDNWEDAFIPNQTTPANTIPPEVTTNISSSDLNKLSFDELAEYEGVNYQGLETYDYDGKKYHKFVQTFDDGREFVLRFEEGAVKSYLKKGIATPNEIIHEVYKVPKILRQETREIWFKNNNSGIEHKPTKSGYDSFDARTAGYNLHNNPQFKSMGLTDYDHKIVINPKNFKGATGRYASIWEQDPDDVSGWKRTIHHEFAHSGDLTKEIWDNDGERKCFSDDYIEIHKEEKFFTAYANTMPWEEYAEHGGYVSYMLNNPNDKNKLLTVNRVEDHKFVERNITFEEYKELYPKHYEYFKNYFNGE